MDKGFRRIAFTILGLTTITVISVGIYLWYNFNARSRLVLVIPANADWFFHAQTKLLRSDFSNSNMPPKGIKELKSQIGGLLIFKKLKDAGQPGIALYSDVVAFGLPQGCFFALSLTSEERFKTFLQTLRKQNLLKGGIDKGRYFYAEFPNAKAYIAFKFKAMVIFVPNKDNALGYEGVERAFDLVFAEKTHTMMQKKIVQELYKDEPEVVFYSSKPIFGLSQSIDFPRLLDGEATDSAFVQFKYPELGQGQQPSPMMLVAKAKLPVALESCIDPKNRMNSTVALDLMARVLNQNIQQLSK